MELWEKIVKITIANFLADQDTHFKFEFVENNQQKFQIFFSLHNWSSESVK